MSDISGKLAIVVGASRGLGHAIATSLAAAGADVIAVSRTAADYPARGDGAGFIHAEVADAGDPDVAVRLLDRHDPDIVVLVAGAPPPMRPLLQQSWETFSVNWEMDVRMTFHWLQAMLKRPLRPGSRVVIFGSGASLHGSPLSGGYAGAKAMQRFLAAYAQDEARRAGLDITFTAILPRFSPSTGVGGPAVQAYADRAGKSVDAFLRGFVESTGPLVTPEGAGAAVIRLATEDADTIGSAYLLTGDGLEALSTGGPA